MNLTKTTSPVDSRPREPSPYYWPLPLRLYPVRGSEWSGLGGSHGCPGRIWDRFL